MFWRFSTQAQQPLLSLQEAAARKIVHRTVKPDLASLPLPGHLLEFLTNSYDILHHLQLSEFTTTKLRASYRSTPLEFKEDTPLSEEDYGMIHQYPRTFEYLPQPDHWLHVVRYYFVKSNLFNEAVETFYLCLKCVRYEFRNNCFLLKKMRCHFSTSVEELSRKFNTFAKLALCRNCLRTPIANILTEDKCCAMYNRHYEVKCVECFPPFSCVTCYHTTLKYSRWQEDF